MEKREKYSKVIIIFFILCFVWILLQFLSPLILPTGTVQDLSGLTIVSDNEETIEQIAFPWDITYTVGDKMCHQKASRSFFINDNQMPFCSRCTAIWLGLALGVGFMVFYKINLDEKFVFVILLGLVPMGVDGTGQLLGFWESTNLIRLVTGLLVGVLCGLALGIIVDEIKTLRSFD